MYLEIRVKAISKTKNTELYFGNSNDTNVRQNRSPRISEANQ